MKKIYRVIFLFVCMVGVIGSSYAVAAISANGYTSAKPIKPGLAVALTQNGDSSSVELASNTNKGKFLGISIKPGEATITTTDESSNVYVVSDGEVVATVTDINGAVKEGDYLVLSPLKGTLMKATEEDTTALAVALEDINDALSTTEKVNNRGNPDYEVKLNTIRVDLSAEAIAASGESKSFLIVFGKSLTGKSVSAVQVVVAFVIFFLLLIIEGSIIYGSIYSSITALGRNPLSKKAVYKELAQVTGTALVILAAGLVAIYLVLWA